MVLRLSLRAVLVVAGVAGAIACAIAYVSTVRLQDALVRSLHTLDYPRALRDIRSSGSALNPTAYREATESLALMEVGRPAAAEGVAVRLTRREPRNAQTWITLSRIQVTRRETSAARSSWARARRLDPNLRRALPYPIPLARRP